MLRITGKYLPKHQSTGVVADPNDAWIRKILEYEAARGSAAGAGLSNWGYNSRNPSSIEEAINFFKQDYLPKVQQFPMGLRERLGDYAYNTGRNINDLLLYAAGKISLDDINSSKVFTDEWNRYKGDIEKLYTDPAFINQLDQKKLDIYRTTKQQSGQPNPAFAATWQPRVTMWGTYGAPATTAVTTNSQLPYFPELNTRPVIDEATIDRPEPDNDGIPVITQDELDKVMAQYAKKDAAAQQYLAKPKTITRQPGIATASMITAGLQGIGSILQNADDRRRRERFRIESGRTDSYFPTVPNPFSRGTEEMNTGAFMPSMYTPVQFPGIPTPNYYGRPRFQVGGEFYVPGTSSLLPSYGPDYLDLESIAPPPVSAPTSVSAVTQPVSVVKPAANVVKSSTDVTSVEEKKSTPELETAMAARGFALPVLPYTFDRVGKFGPRKAPTADASTEHNGNDVRQKMNSPLFSPKDGVVKSISINNKGGKQLVIFHPDGTRSGFAHLNEFLVKEGDQVKMGQLVARSGNTGVSTGPHLHFTYGYHDGTKTTKLIDPNSVFNFENYIRSKKPKGYSGDNLTFTETTAKTKSNVVDVNTNHQISFTHNNPLNIHYGKFAKGYGGTKGHPDSDGNVAIFNDFSTGITAARDLLFGPSYRDLTVEKARARWVGSSDSKSISNIVKAMGGNKILKDLTIGEQERLIKEFARWEGREAYNLIKDMDLKPYLRENKSSYKEGGEYELDDNEIDYILSMGGEIEYL